jgi:hypothetical protein
VRSRSAGTDERWKRALERAAATRPARVAAVVLVLTVAAHAAHADTGREAFRYSLGVLTGTTAPDPALADYQWDVTPHVAWGVEALAERGRFGTGLRLWRTQTTQDLGFAGTSDPTVRSTTLEVLGLGRLATLWGTECLATASAGWLHMGYDPEHVSIDPFGSGTPIDVRFAPIDEWIAGAGLGFRQPLAASWSLGIGVDRRMFELDTSHRSGSGIVTERQAFGEWSARLELARRLGRR